MTSENEQNKDAREDPFDIEPVKDPSSTAEEFLHKRDLAGDRWHTKGDWIFRGQNCAKWKLIPKLFRIWDSETRGDYELKLIDAFIRTANIVGLSLPANSLGYFSYARQDGRSASQRNLQFKSGSRPGWLYDFGHVAFAIAQHSGVPTRLLDFTYDPFVAAYFAAECTGLLESLEMSSKHKAEYFDDIIRRFRRSPSDALPALEKYSTKVDAMWAKLPKEMAVWAISIDDLQQTTLRWLDHPYGQISNLRAQKGAFICETEFYESEGVSRRSFNEQLSDLIDKNGIYKLTLPTTQREELLRLLSRKRINEVHLKPSYETVADEVVNMYQA